MYNAARKQLLGEETARRFFDMFQPEAGAQQRRWTRHRIDVRLKVSFSQNGAAATAYGRANILSQGGMGAFIPGAIPVGTLLEIEVTFPYSSTALQLKAVVRSCEGFRYGLEFRNLTAQARSVIEKNCNSTTLLQ